MKKIICILALALIIGGCGESGEITLAREKGFECDEIIAAIEEHYGRSVTVKEVGRDEISRGDSDIMIGAVPMGDSLDYGMWKSKTIKYEMACVVSRDEYRMTTDLEDVDIGIPDDFEYLRYISLPEEASVTPYSDKTALVSDLKEGVIGAVICSDGVGEDIAAAVDGARVNTLYDSNIYEYAVMSEDVELINSLDAVIE